MKSRFPLSLESIPRQENFFCLSLKFGCLFSGIVVIIYSVLSIAQCLIYLKVLPNYMTSSEPIDIMTYTAVLAATISHAATLFLSSLMLVGAIKEKVHLIRPWIIWVSIQVTVSALLFIFWSLTSMINHAADNSLIVYLIEGIVMLARIYTLSIVGSYYKQLEEENDERKVRLVNLGNSEIMYSTISP
ncbi:uncharacterized protein ACR2FA_007158 [Aphomia sociella]